MWSDAQFQLLKVTRRRFFSYNQQQAKPQHL
jgi:hypothetical protein